VQQVDRIHNLVSLVASGLGVALCPASLQYFAPPGVAFRALKDPLSLFYAEFGVSWREEDDSALTAGFIHVAHDLGRTAPHKP